MTTTQTDIRVNEIKTWLYDHDLYFTFSDDEEWDRLVDHIRFHKYILGEGEKRSIGWDDALRSWRENVMIPLKEAVESSIVKTAFPGKPIGDLYLAVSDHWYYLRQQDSRVSPEGAARSFAARYGNVFGKLFSRFFDYPAPGEPDRIVDDWTRGRLIHENVERTKQEAEARAFYTGL